MDADISEHNPALDSPHPGTDGIWIFLFIDMNVFLVLFLTYLSERVRLPELFAESQHQLNALYGLSNTLLLLTSSAAVVVAVHAARRIETERVRRFLAIGMLFGGLFCVNKIIEYSDKIGQGITPATNSFFGLYFAITIIHFMHVIGGLAFLQHCRGAARTEIGTLSYTKRVENVALFWHFVDILWLFIFPLLYLVGLVS